MKSFTHTSTSAPGRSPGNATFLRRFMPSTSATGLFVLITSLGLVSNLQGQILYDADLTGSVLGFEHTTSSGVPTAGSQISGTNWTIEAVDEPQSDTSLNYFRRSGNNSIEAADYGGEGLFFSNNIDVSGWDFVSFDFVAQGDFNDGSEFFQWEYTLDGGSNTVLGNTTGDTGGTAQLNQSPTIDVTGISTLTVGFRFDHNGGEDFIEVSNVQVDGLYTDWSGVGSGSTWQDGAQGGFVGNYLNDLVATVTFEGTGEAVTTSGTVEAGNLTFSSDGYTVDGNLTLGQGDIEVTNVSDTATISANISGAGSSGLAKQGDGTLVLSGNNTFTGATTVEAGTLEIQSANALGTTAGGTTVADGATLAISGGVTTAAEDLTLNGTGVNGGGVLRNLSGTNEFAGAVDLASDTSIVSDAGTLTLSGGVDGAGNAITIGGAGNTTVSTSGVTGSGTSIIKENSGTLALNAAGAYSGGTVISDGVVRIGNDTGLGTGSVDITDGDVLVESGVTVANNINVSSPIASGVEIFSETFETDGLNTRYTAPSGSGGSGEGSEDYFDRISNSTSDRSYTNVQGTFYWGGQDTDSVVTSGTPTLLFSGIDITNATDLDFSGYFAEERPEDSGEDDIDSTDFFLLEYQIDSGGFQNLLAFESSGSSNTPFLEDTDFNGTGDGTQLETAFAEFMKTISGTGSTLDLRFTTSVNSGDEDIAFDALSITATAPSPGSGGNVVLGSDIPSGTATFSGNVTLDEDVNLTAASGGTTEFSGIIQDGVNGAADITKIGAGRVVLSGNNTYTGSTTVSAGTLEVDTDSLPGSVENNATLIFNQTFDDFYAGDITGTGSFTKTGSGQLTLTGSRSDYSGGTTVSAGTLIGDESNLQGSIVNNAAVVYTNTGTYSGSMSGTGTLTKTGGGNLTLSGANTFTGSTTVTGGTLTVDGSLAGSLDINSGATLAGSGTLNGAVTIGGGATHNAGNSPGTQTFTSGLTYADNSTFTWELIGNTTVGAGTNWDQVIVTGDDLVIGNNVTADLVFNLGTSSVDWDNTFWDSDQEWLVFDAASLDLSGAPLTIFGTTNISADFSGGDDFATARPQASFAWIVDGTDIKLTYTAIPEPGTILMVLISLGSMGVLSFLRRRR